MKFVNRFSITIVVILVILVSLPNYRYRRAIEWLVSHTAEKCDFTTSAPGNGHLQLWSLYHSCKCEGTKFDPDDHWPSVRPENPIADLHPNSTTYCYGKVSNRTVYSRFTEVHVRTEPSDATVTVTLADGLTMDAKKYKDGKSVAIRQPYEDRDGKKVFSDAKPIHIDVSKEGYRKWSTDLVIDADPMVVNAFLTQQ
jgi:hypothetical protein